MFGIVIRPDRAGPPPGQGFPQYSLAPLPLSGLGVRLDLPLLACVRHIGNVLTVCAPDS